MSFAATVRGGRGRTVLVVGAGVAGAAAALAAARSGASVTVLDGGTGASTLATGALDLGPWEHAASSDTSLHEEARTALDTLGGYAIPSRGSLLLTTAGLVRRARGHDAALLDVAPTRGGRVAVVRCPRAGWDADGLARAWGERFFPLDAAVLRTTDERVVPDADLAERHDDEARRDWLAARLREALARSEGSWAAIVLPPLLGIDRARAEELTQRVGAPCGEAMGLPGGPSGLRFERASRRAYAGAGIAHVVARATRVARAEGHFIVQTEEEGAFEAQAVVLAAGGLLGGGLEYAPSDSELATALPAAARLAFRLTIDAPATVGASRRPLEIPGSLFGVPPESLADRAGATSLLDHTGILTRGDGTVLSDMPDEGVPGLFAAGEIVADAPRFWLSALSSGTIAGVSAARFVASGSATPFHHFERGGLDAGGV